MYTGGDQLDGLPPDILGQEVDEILEEDEDDMYKPIEGEEDSDEEIQESMCFADLNMHGVSHNVN